MFQTTTQKKYAELEKKTIQTLQEEHYPETLQNFLNGNNWFCWSDKETQNVHEL